MSTPTTALTGLPVVDQEAVRVAATPASVAVVWLGQRFASWPRLRPSERDAATGERRRMAFRGDGTATRVGSCSLLALADSGDGLWTAWVEPDAAGVDVLRVGGGWQSSIDVDPTIMARSAAIGSVAMTAVGDGAVLAWLDREAAAVRWVRVGR